ncbi:MAG: hypothetical protein ABI222_06775 [Opitutaceae bacterium]
MNPIPTRVIIAKQGRIVFSICGIPFILLGASEVYSAHTNHDLRWALFMVIVATLFTLSGWMMKITVNETGISHTYYFRKHSMRWDELGHSVVYGLLEADYPIGIKLYHKGEQTTHVKIRLKNYPKPDVQWMIRELPFKITAHKTYQIMGPNGSGDDMPD